MRPETIPSEILDYYAGGQEEQRLTAAAGRLEWIRTWELLERFLPPAPARILDVGGGTGVYALPLAARGYHVHLIDAAANHVERARALSSAARHPLTGADEGDARRLPIPDRTVDMVLLFGPLYHLIERADRVAALREARRVLVDGGLLLAACISRFASAYAGIQEGVLRDPAFASIVDGDLRNGIHRNPTSRPDWFTTAFLHRPDEIAAEIGDGGFAFEQLLPIEGPGWMSRDLDAWLNDAAERDRLLHVVRQLEAEPSLIGASAHLLAVARR